MPDISKFDYYLPKSLIAQSPKFPRDTSRLMIINKSKKIISEDIFFNLDNYLQKGDLLIFNDSKVIPARLFLEKTTSGKIEFLFLGFIDNNIAKAMIKGKVSKGLVIEKAGLKFEFLEKEHLGIWKVRISNFKEFFNLLFKEGKTPIPPYIKTKLKERELRKKYQTIFAKKPGSIAAPTAGFHFTKRVFKKLKQKGIKWDFLTLYVNIGTFLPVKVRDYTKHKIFPEKVEITRDLLNRIKLQKISNNRIIAVGTTVTRVLESRQVRNLLKQKFYKNSKYNFEVKTYIYPGFQFRIIDGLITNFHLPKSTLLLLVSAFAGEKLIFKAYKYAIKKKYRFYSFGDAMLIF